MIGPEHETVRAAAPGAVGFGDAVTFAFGDPSQALYGSVRLGLVPGDPALASGLGLLFCDGELTAIDAAGGIELAKADWSAVEAGDVRATIEQPLHAWQVAYDGDDGGFELRFEALGPPGELSPPGLGGLAESAAGLHGYEQLCRVSGSARCGERRLRVDCLGQRGHQWGAPDWERIALARTVSAWFEGAPGVALASVRPTAADGHADEVVDAWLLGEQDASAIAEPLLSTTLDRDGRQRRASLELWETRDEDAYPHRAAGEAVCGTTLDLGRLRLDCAFFRWRMEGHEGVGRYDVLRRA